MRYSSPIILTGRLHFLDAMRGLAAVSVMIFHMYSQSVSPIHHELASSIPAWTGLIVQEMYCGVEVFFVLSGFVIAFAMDGQTTNLRYAGNFIVRRSLRLDPPYWIAMALMLCYLLIRWPSLWHGFYVQYGGVRGLAANLFYVQNLRSIYPASSILDVSWTLCLEVQFYLAYLVMLVGGHYAGLLMPRRATAIRRTLIVLSVTLVAGWSLMHWIQDPSFGFTGRAWTFFLGVAIYAAMTRGAPSIAVAGCLISLAALFVWKQEPRNIVTVATAAAIYFAGMTGRLSTLLAFRPLLYLGKVSYSIYLLHMVIGLNLLQILSPLSRNSVAGAWISLVTAIACVLLGAQLLHRWVEAPSNRLSQRLKRPRLE
jgi:peptidoglycan/LPS O-acetylase OafA/YrhL